MNETKKNMRKIDPRLHSHVIFIKDANTISGSKTSFNKWYWKNWISTWRKNKF